MRYATGLSWLGDKELFGSTTFYFAARTAFQFVETTTGISKYKTVSGYTIELIPQTGGNLKTETIPQAQF
jgi:hypothetical protein